MTERRRRILALLWTLDDLLPGPKGASFAHGLAPAAKRPCPDCGHTDSPGWLVDRFKRREPCLTCGGRPAEGGRRAKRGRGFVQVDPMDAEQQPLRTDHADVPTRPAVTKLCDACGGDGTGGAHLRDPLDPGSEYRDPCPRCNGSGRRTVAVFDLGVDRDRDDAPLESALDRRREQGSYHELEQALGALPKRWRRLIRQVYVLKTRSLGELAPDERAILEASLVAVEFLMDDPIRVPAGVRAAAKRAETEQPTRAHGRGATAGQRERRDKEIRKLVRQGKPTQWIAQQYGLSVATVNRVAAGDSEQVA